MITPERSLPPLPPCQAACPAGIDVPAYVALIGQGDYAQAVEVIRRDNPFPWVCGLVCTRPCEAACVRGRIDAPVAIRPLKAFTAEWALQRQPEPVPQRRPWNGKKVGIVGAGPAGLTAAHYLARLGYGVRVIDTLPAAGGMLLAGIPGYRLPREVVEREVAFIRAQGVEFRLATVFGRDVTWQGLQAEGFAALLLAVGTHKPRRVGIPGEDDFLGVLDALAFLNRLATGNRDVLGRRVIVIGGGNVAIDAARTAIRLGATAVTIVYRRGRQEMPADAEDVRQAEEEGVRLLLLAIPAAVVGEGGRVTALRCLRAELAAPAGDGPKRPVPIEGSAFLVEAETVITAVGEEVGPEILAALPGLRRNERGTLVTDPGGSSTSLTGVFAAGDAVTGPATVVEAIGAGKRAAAAIDRYLAGGERSAAAPAAVPGDPQPCLEMPLAVKLGLTRAAVPLLEVVSRQASFDRVELGLTEEMARGEARRCLRCDICTRCGRCAEACRQLGVEALPAAFLSDDPRGSPDFLARVGRCILCGACASRCPTGAMRCEDRGEERVLALCGSVLARGPLELCRRCGVSLGPAVYLDNLRDKLAALPRAFDRAALCPACARERAAAALAAVAPFASVDPEEVEREDQQS